MQNKSDAFKILILAVFIGFIAGSANAQITPVAPYLPAPVGVDKFVNVGEATPLQIKKGNLGVIGTVSAIDGSFQQYFKSDKTSYFRNNVTINGGVDFFGGFGASIVDVSGNFSTNTISHMTGAATTVRANDEVMLVDLIDATRPTPPGSFPWGDRLCYQQNKSTQEILLVVCPSGI